MEEPMYPLRIEIEWDDGFGKYFKLVSSENILIGKCKIANIHNFYWPEFKEVPELSNLWVQSLLQRRGFGLYFITHLKRQYKFILFSEERNIEFYKKCELIQVENCNKYKYYLFHNLN